MIDGYTLAIESATYEGSAAVFLGAKLLAEHDLAETKIIGKQGRSEGILPAVEDCIRRAEIQIGQLDRIVCGAGPGSFTSLRIAASIAKGLAAGAGIQLYQVPSLALTVAAADRLQAGKYLSTLDAMRNEAYVLHVELMPDGRITHGPSARRIATDQLERVARSDDARIIGPGRAIDARPQAKGIARLFDLIIERGPVDLRSWEPDYGRPAEAQVRWEAMHGPLENAR